MSEFQWPPPLDVKCTSADCENELHCFKQRKKTTGEQRGKCRYRSADLVDCVEYPTTGTDLSAQVSQRSFLVMEPLDPARDRRCHRSLNPALAGPPTAAGRQRRSRAELWPGTVLVCL